MRSIERFLRDGTPPSPLIRTLPPASRKPAVQLALRLGWQRRHLIVRQNLAAFHELPPLGEPARLIGAVAARMAAVLNAAVDPFERETPGSDLLRARAREALGEGHGLIVCTARLGYWQLPLRLLARIAPTWLADARALQLRWVDPRLGIASGSGTRVPRHAPRLDGFMDHARALLECNQVVGFLSDVPPRTRAAVPVWLLGRRVLFHGAPAMLSRTARVPVLPISCALGASAPELHVGGFLGGSPEGRTAAGHGLLQGIADCVGESVARYPDQWLGWLIRWSQAEESRRPEFGTARPASAALACAC